MFHLDNSNIRRTVVLLIYERFNAIVTDLCIVWLM